MTEVRKLKLLQFFNTGRDVGDKSGKANQQASYVPFYARFLIVYLIVVLSESCRYNIAVKFIMYRITHNQPPPANLPVVESRIEHASNYHMRDVPMAVSYQQQQFPIPEPVMPRQSRLVQIKDMYPLRPQSTSGRIFKEDEYKIWRAEQDRIQAQKRMPVQQYEMARNDPPVEVIEGQMWQSHYLKNNSAMDVPPPRQKQEQVKSCCSPIILGIIGLLALGGLTAIIVLSLKNGSGYGRVVDTKQTWSDEGVQGIPGQQTISTDSQPQQNDRNTTQTIISSNNSEQDVNYTTIVSTVVVQTIIKEADQSKNSSNTTKEQSPSNNTSPISNKNNNSSIQQTKGLTSVEKQDPNPEISFMTRPETAPEPAPSPQHKKTHLRKGTTAQ